MTNLTRNQAKGILALMTHPTVAAAAESIGVTRTTMHHWLTQDDFKAELARAASEALERAADSIAAGAIDAIKILRKSVVDESLSISERNAAADKLLRHLPAVRLLGRLEKRITELELSNDNT